MLELSGSSCLERDIFMQNCHVILFAILVSTLCLSQQTLAASKDLSLLEAGMSVNAVIKELGPPKTKIEKEVKREELWYYSFAELIFRGGSLALWKERKLNTDTAKAQSVSTAQDSINLLEAELSEEGSEQQVAIADILSEIMEDAPSETTPSMKRE